MSSPIFNAMGGGNQFNLMQLLSQLARNPVQFLMNRKLNIPDNISNDPQAIIQHLLNTGQMSQDAYNKYQNMVNQMTRR